MILNLLLLPVLSIPVIWEVTDDRNGDKNKQRDVVYRIILMIAVSFIVHFVGPNFYAALNMSIAIFFLCFDYVINIVLYKNNVIDDPRWFSNLGKVGVIDNIKIWRNAGAWTRFWIRFGYFSVGLVIYLLV